MKHNIKKQTYTAGQILGIICIVLLLSPIILRGFIIFFSVPIFLLGLINCDIFLKSHISSTLGPINIGAALYVTIWVCSKMWPRKKNFNLKNSTFEDINLSKTILPPGAS